MRIGWIAVVSIAVALPAAAHGADASQDAAAPREEALQTGAASLEQAAPPPVPVPQTAPARGSENAITQAEDAFGFSSGKETLGLYSMSNVRGFSPVTAGNVRIEGLYFDQVFGLTNRVRQSSQIRVGLSAQGTLFPAPTGIVDYRLYKPGGDAMISGLVSGDSYGTITVESDWILPLDGDRLSLASGFYQAWQQLADGTTSNRNIQGAVLRWHPSPVVDLMPFWTRSEIKDQERAPRYIPAGPYLPPEVPRQRFDGPAWADQNSTGLTYGIVGAIRPSPDWLARIGVFRSRLDDPTDFVQLFRDLQPDGSARRIIIADPPSQAVANSGEIRVSRTIAEGPRQHIIHLTFRARDRRELFGGSETIDFGPTMLGDSFEPAKPTFAFGEQSKNRVRQWTGGVAYDGRWGDAVEVSAGVAHTDYSKEVRLPGLMPTTAKSGLLLYYGSIAGHLTSRLTAYASKTKGLEESGVAPDNAINRNEPLPAIVTVQSEVGLLYALTSKLRASAGVFQLNKPYYNLNQTNHFVLLGDVRNRGLELSLAGSLTPRLNVVAGAVLLDPVVTGEGVTLGRVGPRPVGLPRRTFIANLDWRPPGLDGISFDVAVTHDSEKIATRDNSVSLPPQTLIDLGGRYRFSIDDQPATLRVKLTNITDRERFDIQGAGAYQVANGRLLTAYLSIEL